MMTNNRSVLIISAIALILLALVPVASADVIIDEELTEWVDTSVKGEHKGTGGAYDSRGTFGGIRFPDISRVQTLHYIGFDIPGKHGKWKDTGEFITTGRHEFEYEFNGKTRPGYLYLSHSTNLLGQITGTKFTIFLDDWDIGTLTGTQYIELPFYIYTGNTLAQGVYPPHAYAWGPGSYNYPSTPITVTEVSSVSWANQIKIDKLDYGYKITLNREIDNQAYKSTILVNKSNEIIYQSTLSGENEELWFTLTEIDLVTIISPSGKVYSYLGSDIPGDPGTPPVTIYVKSSQTGALLADATVIIKDTTTDPWTEVVNQTLPSGHGTVSLPKDPGFNPTQYYITAIVPGYKDVYNGVFFRVTGPADIVVHMEPIEGGPVDENNTFLEFYVRNLDDIPVSNAMVSVAGQTRWTNAQGWTQFEVAKNASYPYTVSKSGYATIEGTATVADGPRYVVNVVLGPRDIPTQPPGPGEPTPPQPPGGVPGDDGSQGFLSEAIRGISKIFGVGFAAGKTILGMLLAIAIGFATAKQLRGGAAEFGFGLLGGTMLGVLIGLLPVWVVVVLLLIVGMYIGYKYVGGGNNG